MLERDGAMRELKHVYEVRPRKDKRGVDLISIPPESFLICGRSEFRQYAIGDCRTLWGLTADDSPKYSP